MNFSKSKYIRGLSCPKVLWWEVHPVVEVSAPEVTEDSAEQQDQIVETIGLQQLHGQQFASLVKTMYPGLVEVPYSEDLSLAIQRTKELIDAGEKRIAEASFASGNCFCAVDILFIENNEVEIYEIKSSTKIKEEYMHDLAFQVYVLESAGYIVNKVSLIYVNNSYVRGTILETGKMCTIEDVTQGAKGLSGGVPMHLKELEQIASKEDEPDILDICCGKKCPYFLECFIDLPEGESIFDLTGMRQKKKLELYSRGVQTILDAYIDKIPMTAKQIIQAESIRYNMLSQIDLEIICNHLEKYKYPIYFLDFETYQPVIPLFGGKPYQQVPTQFSIHKLNDIGVPLIDQETFSMEDFSHREFLAEVGSDPRNQVARMLVEMIPPNNGVVVAYNMSFEKMVIKNLISDMFMFKGYFPEEADYYDYLAQELQRIHDQIIDLMEPFAAKGYYCPSMHGSHSIKKVLPALCGNDPDLDYSLLPGPHHGGEAMEAYELMVESLIDNPNEVREGLLAYCKLDTLAMMKIYGKLVFVSKFQRE